MLNLTFVEFHTTPFTRAWTRWRDGRAEDAKPRSEPLCGIAPTSLMLAWLVVQSEAGCLDLLR